MKLLKCLFCVMLLFFCSTVYGEQVGVAWHTPSKNSVFVGTLEKSPLPEYKGWIWKLKKVKTLRGLKLADVAPGFYLVSWYDGQGGWYVTGEEAAGIVLINGEPIPEPKGDNE